MNTIKKSFQYGAQQVTLETGKLARQADGAVMVDIADTRVLVSAVCKQSDETARDFLPLTVNYQERTYSGGKIPGGFFKREGRPSERETLFSRLIDRPIRPLFPKGFYHDIQVIATVMSLNPDVEPDVAALLGASASLAISGIPFNGPVGAARVGFRDGHYILNPTVDQLSESQLDLVVAGTDKAVLMVESQAKELSEAKMLGAVTFGHEQMQTAIQAIRELAAEVGKPVWEWSPPAVDETLAEKCASRFRESIADAYQIKEKAERHKKLQELKSQMVDELADEQEENEIQLYAAFTKLEKEIMRARIINGEPRIDGRDTRTVRPIYVETGYLPRTHGSAVFTRGETQVMAVATLGTERDSQIIDAIEGEFRDRFMFHYNFPPYCVGEVGFMGSPKRREIGHGRLAKRGLLAVMPDAEKFPYVIRLVSEVTESNGSSSMASVCSASLALMDAGVPIKAPVSGIAMGLILEENRFAVLSDIMGDEDHFGDMDFKVAGTEQGVTALQMDIKVEGVTPEIMMAALKQASEGRMHILGEMNKALSVPGVEMSKYAPRLLTIKVPQEKIRDIIGKGGATIRALTDETGAVIEVDDNGLVTIASSDEDAANLALKRIEDLTAEAEVGKVYDGTVVRIVDFGACVTIFPGQDGLVHISQIADEHVDKVTDRMNEGDRVKVKVLEIDRQGRVRLSMKGIEQQ